MKKLSVVNLILISTLLISVSLAEDIPEDKQKTIEVVLGIDKVERLDFAPSTKVQVGNESILTYQLIPQKREITFKGMKPGKTSVILRNNVGDIMARYIVNITASSQSKVVQELREFLGDVEGIEIGIKGESVYIGGKIIVPGDIGKVVTIMEKYDDVLSLVELSPHTQRVIARKMQEVIQKSGMKDVTVRIINGSFWLEGVATSSGGPAEAEAIAYALLPDRIQSLAKRTDSVESVRHKIIQNFIKVNEKKQQPPEPKLLKISAQFVELIKDYAKIFGFKWTPLLAGDGGSISFGKSTTGGVTTRSNDTLSGTISNLFPKLASAKAAGHARIIQSGVIILKDGIKGQINKQTTKTFAVGSGEFQQAQKAVSGFELSVKPQISGKEKVELQIGLGVSSTTGDPPEVASNKLSTTIVVKSKESAVVGGVVVNKNATDYDRDSPFGQTQAEGGDPLFSFLRSKSYTSNKSQFVVFITPEIIESAAEGTDEIKRKFRRRGI